MRRKKGKIQKVIYACREQDNGITSQLFLLGNNKSTDYPSEKRVIIKHWVVHRTTKRLETMARSSDSLDSLIHTRSLPRASVVTELPQWVPSPPDIGCWAAGLSLPLLLLYQKSIFLYIPVKRSIQFTEPLNTCEYTEHLSMLCMPG